MTDQINCRQAEQIGQKHPPTRTYKTWASDSQRWRRYCPRSGDIVITTYPKSGTTWMQQIVCLLVFQSPEPRPIGEISPWLDRRPDNSGEDVIEMLERQSHRRFLKSHTPFDGMPMYDGVKYIHVARDGRDACLSYHNHCADFTETLLTRYDEIGHTDKALGQAYPRAPKDPRHFFHRWMSEGISGDPDGMPYLSWFNFESVSWRRRIMPNVLMVHYRDLKSDLEEEMRRVAAFLEIETPEALWPELVAAATFDRMRKASSKFELHGVKIARGGADRFFHKGQNNRWVDVLTSEDVSLYERKMEESLSPACSHWLTAGRSVAGDPRSVIDEQLTG